MPHAPKQGLGGTMNARCSVGDLGSYGFMVVTPFCPRCTTPMEYCENCGHYHICATHGKEPLECCVEDIKGK